MQIGFTGAHCTGMSTLCTAVSHRITTHSARITGECTERICDLVGDRQFFKPDRTNLHRQMLVFLYKIVDDLHMVRPNQVILHDRTMIDYLAYTLAYFPDFRRSHEFEVLLVIAEQVMKRIDIVFKLTIEDPETGPGVTETDLQFQRDIDLLINEICQLLSVKHILLPGQLEARSDKVMMEIHRFGIQ